MRLRRGILAAAFLLTGMIGVVLLPGCTADVPTARSYFHQVYTPTSTPATPVVCETLFNACESMTENGTWSGVNATRALSSSWFTEGTSSLKCTVVNPTGWNDNILVLSAFTPALWQGLRRISMDLLVDPGVVNGASYSQFHMVVDADWPISKYYRIVVTNFPKIVVGQQSVTFNIDFAADVESPKILPTDPISKLTLIYNRSTPLPGQGTGNIYVDNVRFHYCP